MKQEQPYRTRTTTHSTAFPCVVCPQTYFTGYRYKKRPTTLLHNEPYTPESYEKYKSAQEGVLTTMIYERFIPFMERRIIVKGEPHHVVYDDDRFDSVSD